MLQEKGLDPGVTIPGLGPFRQHRVKEYLFCKNCENLFNSREQYVAKEVYNGRLFLLLTRMQVSPGGRTRVSEGLSAYLGKTADVDAIALAYYAISLVWRASIAEWRTPEGATLGVELGKKRQDQFRQYLLGEIDIPHDVAVAVTVCEDKESQESIFTPTRITSNELTMYDALVRGIYFCVFVDLPRGFPRDQVCCVNSPWNLIFSASGVQVTKQSFTGLSAMGKVADNLKRYLPPK